MSMSSSWMTAPIQVRLAAPVASRTSAQSRRGLPQTLPSTIHVQQKCGDEGTVTHQRRLHSSVPVRYDVSKCAQMSLGVTCQAHAMFSAAEVCVSNYASRTGSMHVFVQIHTEKLRPLSQGWTDAPYSSCTSEQLSVGLLQA